MSCVCVSVRCLGIFAGARKGAFKALDRLRDEGVIKAWGLGVNRVEPIELLLDLESARPDAFLLAGRYTLLDHDRALQRVMPKVAERGLGIVVGGPRSEEHTSELQSLMRSSYDVF